MSFPKTLATSLAEVGMAKVAPLVFERLGQNGPISWQLSFRTLGFGKDQIDGAIRYRHAMCTDFGWKCLFRFAGRNWSSLADRFAKERYSAGFPIALVAGWRSNHTFDNRGMNPDQAAVAVAKDVKASVLPFFARLDSDEALLDFLVKDEEPFPWFRSQCLSRLAEVAKLEQVLKVPESRLENLASTHRQMLTDQLDNVALETYVESIRHAASSDA